MCGCANGGLGRTPAHLFESTNGRCTLKAVAEVVLVRRAELADDRAFVLYDWMAGYGVKPTLERLSDDACERRLVAEPGPTHAAARGARRAMPIPHLQLAEYALRRVTQRIDHRVAQSAFGSI